MLRKMELRLDVLLGSHSRLFSAVLVGRREEADRNRYAGVKVQIADFLGAGERLLECLSTDRKEDKKGSLASLGKKEKEAAGYAASFILLDLREAMWRGEK